MCLPAFVSQASFPRFFVLFISSCYLIISVLSQSISVCLPGPPGSESTPLDPESVSAFSYDSHGVFSACHSSFRSSPGYNVVCMYRCVLKGSSSLLHI